MPARELSTPASAPPSPAVLILLALAASTLIAFHGALGYFFAQDDFAGLARARGLLEPLSGPWRWLSGQAYFVAMRGLADLNPLPYRVASLLAHLATAALLLAWLRRRVGLPAAWLGATFFAVHPAIFTALYSVSGIGEILSLGFALAALLLVGRHGAARGLAVPAYALSLLSKEATLLLPVLAAFEPRAERGRRAAAPWRDPVVVTLAAVALAYALYFARVVARVQFGVGADAATRAAAPYALAFDGTMLWNFVTYAGWVVNFTLPTVRSFTDVVSRSFTPAAALALALWIAGAFVPALRARGWLTGGAMAAAFLLPVLPLPHHTYHYYLYAPLAGAALCVAALADLALAPLARPAPPPAPRRGRGRSADAPAPPTVVWGWWVAGGVALLLTANGALLARKIEHHPFLHPDLRSDPTVDRARIARHVYLGLGAAGPPRGARVRFWSPLAAEIERAAGRDAAVESYWERNVREALMDGLAVRVLFPQVASVGFVHAFEPATDESTWYAVYAVDGQLRLVSAAELAATLAALPAAVDSVR